MFLVAAIVLTSLLGVLLCSLSEAALYAVSRSRIETLKRLQRTGGDRLSRLRDKVEEPISAILIANTVFMTLGAIWSGALVEAFPSFHLETVLARVAEKAFTVFMAVPTIYVKLIRAFEEASPAEREPWAQGFASMRLMISGSAALPAATHRKWTSGR